MSELVPTTGRAPARRGGAAPAGRSGAAASGEAAAFHALQAELARLAAEAEQLQEMAAVLARQMDDNADLARTTAEQTAAAEVAPRHVGQVHEVSAALGAVAATAKALASRGDAVAAAAWAVKAAHNEEYRAIHEAAQASPVPMAKPGFYQLR